MRHRASATPFPIVLLGEESGQPQEGLEAGTVEMLKHRVGESLNPGVIAFEAEVSERCDRIEGMGRVVVAFQRIPRPSGSALDEVNTDPGRGECDTPSTVPPRAQPLRRGPRRKDRPGPLEALPPDEYPHIAETIVDHALQPGYDYGVSSRPLAKESAGKRSPALPTVAPGASRQKARGASHASGADEPRPGRGRGSLQVSEA